MRNVKLVIVHCSDSDIEAHDNPETIREWHLARGFNDIGYHYVITKDGVVHVGRSENVVGAHCKGHNSESVGICLTGRHKFTALQFKSLEVLAKSICKRYGLDHSDIFPHKYFDPLKTCPNFDLIPVVESWVWA